VDDAPYTGDLDMAAVATRSELAGLLRTVHLRADRPSLRSLEARTRHSASPLSKTAVAEMLKAARFPRRTVMVAFLQTCGVPDSTLGPWPRAWERVAARESRTREESAMQVLARGCGLRRLDRNSRPTLLDRFPAAQARITGRIGHPAVMPLLSRQRNLTGLRKRLPA
jgi:hypothetical protein